MQKIPYGVWRTANIESPETGPSDETVVNSFGEKFSYVLSLQRSFGYGVCEKGVGTNRLDIKQ